jgi:23S rRNA pseudouridine1911/1915/1917 synthase
VAMKASAADTARRTSSAGRVELTVPLSAAGLRLDLWLAEALEGGSRARVQRLVEAGQVLVDGRRRSKGYRLAGRERIVADLTEPEAPREPAAAEPRIAWEDDQLVVVDKPAGLVVHPAPGHRALTLVDLLAERSGGGWQPHVVHRLDKNTSGLMVVAKEASVQAAIRDAIRRREVLREYLALLTGRLAAKSGTIDAPIGRDVRVRTRMSTRTTKPRAARTHFTVEQFLNDYTLVRATLETGRTHQIRAHFAAMGNAVCGDPEYGGTGLLELERQFLHSARLSFAHPGTGIRVDQRSALPDDLAAALGRAEAERK